MRITHDAEADAAYLYFVETIGPGEVAETPALPRFLDTKPLSTWTSTPTGTFWASRSSAQVACYGAPQSSKPRTSPIDTERGPAADAVSCGRVSSP